MLLPRPAAAAAAAQTPLARQRQPQAFVADYDDVVGAFARAAENWVRPNAQRAVQWVGQGIERQAGRSLWRPEHLSHASAGLARGTGMTIMAAGACVAAEACQGALENVGKARALSAAWRGAADGMQSPARAAYARTQASVARHNAFAHMLGAGGGAAMAATLTASPVLLGGLGPLGMCAAAMAAALLYGHRAGVAAGRPPEPGAAGDLPGWAATFGKTGKVGVLCAVVAGLGAAGAVGASGSALAAVSLGSAIGLMGGYALFNMALAAQQARERRRMAAGFERAVAHSPLGEAEQHAARRAFAHRSLHATGCDVGVGVGGFTMVAGLLAQTSYMWPGVFAILAGSVTMELARFWRDELVPAPLPEPLVAADEGRLTAPDALLGQLAGLLEERRAWSQQRQQAHERLAWARRLFASSRSHAEELWLARAWRSSGATGSDLSASLAQGEATSPAARLERANAIAQAAAQAGLGQAFSDRLDASGTASHVPDPATDADYRRVLRAAQDALSIDLPRLQTGAIDALFEDVLVQAIA